MLIFVQVHRTIDKILRSLIGSGRKKESKVINKKEAYKRLKRTAPEVKVLLKTECSWSDDVSSKASSSEAVVHQEMQT